MVPARVPLARPATPTQELVASLLARHYDYRAIGVLLGLSRLTVRWYAKHLAAKIPGDLPMQMRIVVWYRGGSLEVLTGSALRHPPAPAPPTLPERVGAAPPPP